jgi:hypothetical protein
MTCILPALPNLRLPPVFGKRRDYLRNTRLLLMI